MGFLGASKFLQHPAVDRPTKRVRLTLFPAWRRADPIPVILRNHIFKRGKFLQPWQRLFFKICVDLVETRAQLRRSVEMIRSLQASEVVSEMTETMTYFKPWAVPAQYKPFPIPEGRNQKSDAYIELHHGKIWRQAKPFNEGIPFSAKGTSIILREPQRTEASEYFVRSNSPELRTCYLLTHFPQPFRKITIAQAESPRSRFLERNLPQYRRTEGSLHSLLRGSTSPASYHER